MNSSHKNTLYILLNYSFNENIYNLISSIEKFCYSYISVSLQYDFKLYIIYNNFYSLLFPNKSKDSTYFLTSNYSGMHESIEESLNNFLSSVPEYDEELSQSNEEKKYPINIILKKILLEVNKKKLRDISNSPGGFFLGMGSGEIVNDKIILINDSEEDFEKMNQKYIFLLKEKGVKIDILSLNKKNKNDISKAITFFNKGIFDCLNDKKTNIEQMLIFENMPIKFCESMPKFNKDIKYTISYNKSISDKLLECSLCHKSIKKNDIYKQKSKDEIVISDDNDNDINKKETILIYVEKENNIFCKNCFNEMKK